MNESRAFGVKAFQAKTTYELARGDETSKEGMPVNRLLERHIRGRAVSNGQQRNHVPLQIEDELFEKQRDTIASMGNFELKYTRNKAYSFHSTVSVRELQNHVRTGVMQFRRRLINN